jgi:glycosyltransferase involved in cell wall biosynthesis
MSVYNGADYIHQAIESILNQSYEDFELIIINDGSTDTTAQIISSYKDQRITLHEQENKGLVPSLNRALSLARGVYIARHDADDISNVNRFKKQVDYLEQNPETVIVGSSIKVMDPDGAVTHEHHVLTHNTELKQELLVRSPFAHGSVMIRAQAFHATGNYNVNFWPAEDYELWIRMGRVGNFYNFDECLYTYREHKNSISSKNKTLQNNAVKRCQDKAWTHRKDYIKHAVVRFNSYKDLPDNTRQIARIISNTKQINALAIKHKDILFALKNTRLLIRNPLLYKKIAGTIRRKVGKKYAK